MNVYTYNGLGDINHGRLGNQLWQIAWQIGQSEDIPNCRASIKADWKYRKFFDIPDSYYVPVQKGDVVIDGGDGFFQERRYWSRVEKRIRNLFQPNSVFREILPRTFMEVFRSKQHKTAVHVRRGDFLSNSEAFPFVGEEYYFEAIDLVRAEFPTTEIYVFSEDIPWCKKTFGGTVKYIEPMPILPCDPPEIYEMMLMSIMDSHIIANSSFSWWAAMLSNDKNPLYPSTWPVCYKLEEIIPKGWRKVGREEPKIGPPLAATELTVSRQTLSVARDYQNAYVRPIFENFIDKTKVKTIFELGSRDGLYAKAIMEVYGPERIYSFECAPQHIPAVKKNTECLRNYYLCEKAVWSFDGQVDFFLHPEESGSSSILGCSDVRTQKITVPCITLDSFCWSRGIDTIDMICADIEGAEFFAFRNQAIMNSVSYVITEVAFSPKWKLGCPTIEMLDDLLLGYGLHRVAITRAGGESAHLFGDALYSRKF